MNKIEKAKKLTERLQKKLEHIHDQLNKAQNIAYMIEENFPDPDTDPVWSKIALEEKIDNKDYQYARRLSNNTNNLSNGIVTITLNLEDKQKNIVDILQELTEGNGIE